MVKTYKIKMSLTGRATQLPDSQKIFGALIYKYSEKYSSERASRLVSSILKEEIYLAVSNLLPEGYLPCPRQFLLDKLASEEHSGNKRKSKFPSKIIYKEINKRKFILQEDLYKMVTDPENAVYSYPFVYIESSQQIHAALDAGRYNLPGLPPNVYSVPEINVTEAGADQCERMSIKEFVFYLAIDDGAEHDELLAMLDSARMHNQLFFLGARASQGLNTYIVHEIELQPNWYEDETNVFLNLGMLLPNQIDFKNSSLQLYTSERRPYQMTAGWDKGKNGKFISYIEAGSTIRANKGWKDVGRSIQSPFENRDIVFGNSFMLPLNRFYWE